MAETAAAAPATHKQPSRKSKRAWRKNVDITAVQSGLENVRSELVQGGLVSEKAADQLFATDVAGDAEIAKQQQQQGKKLLKADEIIAQRSAVPGLDGRKRKAEEHVLPTTGSLKRYKDGTYVSHKELQRLKRVADNNAGGVAVEEPSATHDPWAAPQPDKNAHLHFLPPPRQTKPPKTLSHAPAAVTATGKPVPHLRKPAGAKSYNPDELEYRANLEREGAAAVEAERVRLHNERLASEQEARATDEAAKVEAAERDDYGTDYESAWESEFEGFLTEGEGEEEHRLKPKPRKTAAERNKAKARKAREGQEKHERRMKEREAQEKRILAIAREMSARDKQKRRPSQALAQKASVDDSEDDEAEVAMQRRRFGKLAIPAAPLEVVLPDELEDSLRRLKPEGNLLTDRYRNLIVNGKIEPRKRVWQRKQARTERLHKWSYKDWELK